MVSANPRFSYRPDATRVVPPEVHRAPAYNYPHPVQQKNHLAQVPSKSPIAPADDLPAYSRHSSTGSSEHRPQYICRTLYHTARSSPSAIVLQQRQARSRFSLQQWEPETVFSGSLDGIDGPLQRRTYSGSLRSTGYQQQFSPQRHHQSSPIALFAASAGIHTQRSSQEISRRTENHQSAHGVFPNKIGVFTTTKTSAAASSQLALHGSPVPSSTASTDRSGSCCCSALLAATRRLSQCSPKGSSSLLGRSPRKLLLSTDGIDDVVRFSVQTV